ncbi:unnamed protein product, partial [Candidula unifasciata]
NETDSFHDYSFPYTPPSPHPREKIAQKVYISVCWFTSGSGITPERSTNKIETFLNKIAISHRDSHA